MSGFLSALVDQFQAELERRENRPFLRAAMAACALVAVADGKVSFPEKVRVDQVLETLDALKVFDPHEGIDLFNTFADDIFADLKKGREAALEAILEGASDKKAKTLLIRICLAVSEANGEKALADQVEIVSLCSHLGVDPGHCGLYVDDLKPLA